MSGSRTSILVVGDPSKWLSDGLERLRHNGFAIHVLSLANCTREEAITALKVLGSSHVYQALVTLNEGSRPLRPLNRDVFEPFLPALRYVSKSGAGYDDVDVDYLTRHGAYFANNPRSVSDPTATTTAMLILQTVRAASQAEMSVRQGKWRQGLEITPDPRDLTVGIVGLGTIGKLVQQKVEALGMKVIYYNRHRLPPSDEGNAHYVTFDELIRTADVVTLHTPLTPETRHMLSDSEFSRMKDGVFIVNTSRGPVIDEEALVRAMKTNKVCRAGLDVFENEPAVHPWLLQSNRTSLLPHWSWATTRVVNDSEKESLENLKAWIYTGKPNTPVNTPRR